MLLILPSLSICMKIGPLTVIKPIPEGVKPMLNQIFCCAKIEPRIDYMSSLALNAPQTLICLSSFAPKYTNIHGWYSRTLEGLFISQWPSTVANINLGGPKNSLMTLNNRLATAAAAIVHKMISLSSPRVFRPVSPFKNGSIKVADILKFPLVVIEFVLDYTVDNFYRSQIYLSCEAQN